jgi:hypothetical protein
LIFFLIQIQNSFWSKIPVFTAEKDFYTYEKLQLANKKYISETELININSFSPEIQKMATSINTTITNEIYEIQDLKIDLLNFYDERNYHIKKQKAGIVIEIHFLKYPYMLTSSYFSDFRRGRVFTSNLRKQNDILLKTIQSHDFQMDEKYVSGSGDSSQTNQVVKNTLLTHLAYFNDESNLFTLENSKDLYSHYSDNWYVGNLCYSTFIGSITKLTELENKLLKLRYETLVFLSIQNDLNKK